MVYQPVSLACCPSRSRRRRINAGLENHEMTFHPASQAAGSASPVTARMVTPACVIHLFFFDNRVIENIGGRAQNRFLAQRRAGIHRAEPVIATPPCSAAKYSASSSASRARSGVTSAVTAACPVTSCTDACPAIDAPATAEPVDAINTDIQSPKHP